MWIEQGNGGQLVIRMTPDGDGESFKIASLLHKALDCAEYQMAEGPPHFL
jgi:hypothetical protein